MIKVTDLTYSKKDFKNTLENVTPIQDDKKMNLDPFPSTADLAILASKVYSDKDEELCSGLPEGFELLTAVDGSYGYYGCLYINPSLQQVVLVHRGTKLSSPGAILTDIIGVGLNLYTKFMGSAVTLGDDIKRAILDLNKQNGVRFTLTITGHSLGGWLSQVTALTVKHLKRQGNEFVRISNIDEGIHAHTVVFDSPGGQNMLIKIQQDYGRYDCTTYSMFRSLDISTFFMAVNLVNATNFHVGAMYQISFNLFFTSGFKYLTFNWNTHSMVHFTKAFEAGNVKLLQVKDWPQGWGERTPVHELEKAQGTYCPETEAGPSGLHYNIGEEDPGTTVGFHHFSEVELDLVNLISMVRRHEIPGSKIETFFDGSLQFQGLFPNFTINKKEKTVTLDNKPNLKKFVNNIKNSLRWSSVKLQVEMEEQKKLTLPGFLLDLFSQECLDSIAVLPDCEDPFGLCDFTNNMNTARVLYVQAADCSLEMARIYALCNTYPGINIDGCIFLNWERLLKLNNILKTKSITLPLTNDRLNLFVISIDSTADITLVKEFFENVFLKFKEHTKKKAVIFSQKNPDWFRLVDNFKGEFAFSCLPLSAQDCLEFTFKDLKDTSRRELLSKEFIILGQQAMSLNTLLGENCQSSASIDDVLRPLLKDLLTDKSFNLNIPNNLLKFDQLDVMFSKINREVNLDSLTEELREECSLFVSSNVRQQLQEVPGVAERLSYISGSGEEDFRQACLNNSSIKVAYWLAATDGRFFFKEVYNCYFPRQFRDQSVVDRDLLSEEDLCARKVVIISDLPGMGKSTTLSSLSRHLVNSWVFRINLKDRPADITNLPAQMSVESVAHFLAGASSEPATLSLLRFCLQNQGSQQIHVLLDGFDEIRGEDAVEKILKLCYFLKNETTAKLIVTTRDTYEDVLVNRLSTVATKFEEITDGIQLKFLVDFWYSHAVLGQKEERLRQFAQLLYEAAHKNLGDTIGLIGIPLHMRMLAETFLQQAEEFSRSAESNPDIIGINNVYNLFKKFTNVKRDIYLKKKISSTSYVIDSFGNMSSEVLTVNHCVLAFEILDPVFKKKYLPMDEKYHDEMKRFGLIRWKPGTHCDFIHRTFAEFFCSLLLVLWLRREDFRYKYLPIEEWFLGNLLINKDFKVVRKFMNEHLAEVTLAEESKQLLYDNMNKCWSKDAEAFRDEDGRTALHVAVKEGNTNIIDLLLGGLATEQTREPFESLLLARDYDGKTALKTGLQILGLQYSTYVFRSNLPIEKGIKQMLNITNLSYELKYKHLLYTFFEANYLFRSNFCSYFLPMCGLDEKNQKDIQLALNRIEVLRSEVRPEVTGLYEKNQKEIQALNRIKVRRSEVRPEVTGLYEKNQEEIQLALNRIKVRRSEVRPEVTGLDEKNQKDIQLPLFRINVRRSEVRPEVTSYFHTDQAIKNFILNEQNDIAERKFLPLAKIHGETAVNIEARAGNYELVNQFIQINHDVVNSRGKSRMTPLHCAAEGGHIELVKLLRQQGAKLNARNFAGRTALSYVAENGNLFIVKYLLKHGADYKTLLHYAIERKQVEIVTYLISEVKVDVNCSDKEGMTPLIYAIKRGYVEIVNYLISEVKVDVNCLDKKGKTPLIYAIEREYVEIVNYLISEVKVDVNCSDKEGKTPLIYAIERGFVKIVKYLISEVKVDVNCSDKEGKTPLIYAIEGGYVEIVKYLISKVKVDVNCSDKEGKTPLIYAIERGYVEIPKYLISEVKVDTNCLIDGKTLLIHAIEGGHVEVVKYLISEVKVDTNCLIDGKTLLIYAMEWGHVAVVKYLISKRKEDINFLIGGRTPLCYSIEKTHWAMMDCLIFELKVDINCLDHFGKTALHYSIEREKWIIAGYLIRAGADPNILDHDGKTPLDYVTNVNVLTHLKGGITTSRSQVVIPSHKTSLLS